MLNRRELLRYAAVGGAVLLPTGHWVSTLTRGRTTLEPFSAQLPVPPVLHPVSSSATGDYYEMSIMPSTTEIVPGFQTSVLTFNGQFPGPTIKARRGRPATVKVTNRMSTPASVHLHGANVAADSDGHPMDAIAPGASKTYFYPNIQPAATLWYHDHMHHLESEQVYRGLAGLYLIDDDETEALGLPAGEFDLPLLIRDANIDESGQLIYVWNGFADRTTVLVNGVSQPRKKVRGRRYRLRLANVSNTRPLKLALSDGSPLVQIASDGGLLRRPVSRTEIELWPAERAEVIVDFGTYPEGTTLYLENIFAGPTAPNRQILRFDVGRRVADNSQVPDRLRDHPTFGQPTVTRNIDFVWNDSGGFYSIDGRGYDPDRIDFQVRRNSTELWQVNNLDGVRNFPHSMHVHLVQFRVLDRSGVPVGEWEAYPKDTVRIPAGQNVRMLVNFDTPYTGVYPFHCHFLDHSAHSMMAQLEVVP